jgi:hypothetical protein
MPIMGADYDTQNSFFSAASELPSLRIVPVRKGLLMAPVNRLFSRTDIPVCPGQTKMSDLPKNIRVMHLQATCGYHAPPGNQQ